MSDVVRLPLHEADPQADLSLPGWVYHDPEYFRVEMAGRFTLCTKLMLQHNLFNNLLPMRTGELSFPVLMARYFAVPALRSVPALLWFRLMDLHSLGIFALAAFQGRGWPMALSLPVLVLWLPLPWLAFHYSHRLQRRLAAEAHAAPLRLSA